MARILNKPVASTALRNLTLDSIIHLLLFSYFLIGLFFPYANQLGIKWQLIAPLIIPLLFLKREIRISELDVLVFVFSFYNILLFYLSGLSIHFNLAIGTLLAFILSKLNLNFKLVFILLSTILILHHLYFNLLPLPFSWEYYAKTFTELNHNFMGANRSSLFILFTYLILFDQKSSLRFIFIPFILIHTSRYHVILVAILEIIKNNLIKSGIIISLILLIIFYVFDDMMAQFYFFRFDDLSTIDRLDRTIEYIYDFIGNYLLPKFTYNEAMHIWPIELISYTGFIGIIIFVFIFLIEKNRLQWGIILLGISGSKTVHDLLLYHVFIAYFLSQCYSRELFVFRFRDNLK